MAKDFVKYDFAVVKGNIDATFKDTSSCLLICPDGYDKRQVVDQFTQLPSKNEDETQLSGHPLKVVAALGELKYGLVSTVRDENEFFVWTMQKRSDFATKLK
ncbi:uncharacterized protein LOC114329672 [Diabrotica virgifera virgifera]|uniref:Uncharacterized protein LOC114329672 n=1 Tax=Diabrotica virgifera virgifera TaxID=50390 RepID=A0A6P7FNX7_DIAVI|nr:uncharacterized protein LOC114329672 [Diabrotica virgifera virgifera]